MDSGVKSVGSNSHGSRHASHQNSEKAMSEELKGLHGPQDYVEASGHENVLGALGSFFSGGEVS